MIFGAMRGLAVGFLPAAAMWIAIAEAVASGLHHI